MHTAKKFWVPIVFACLLLAGCHKDMYDQPKLKPYSESTFFKDGTSFRPLVADTIARGELKADRHLHYGKDAENDDVTTFPFPVTEEILQRGQQRYRIYCTPCHGETGDGQGMVVKRGLRPPPSYAIDRLKSAPVGHFYDVITNGYGAMYPYGYRVPTNDRWAIVAYIRALQFRHDVKADDLSPSLRERLEAAK